MCLYQHTSPQLVRHKATREAVRIVIYSSGLQECVSPPISHCLQHWWTSLVVRVLHSPSGKGFPKRVKCTQPQKSKDKFNSRPQWELNVTFVEIPLTLTHTKPISLMVWTAVASKNCAVKINSMLILYQRHTHTKLATLLETKKPPRFQKKDWSRFFFWATSVYINLTPEGNGAGRTAASFTRWWLQMLHPLCQITGVIFFFPMRY